MPASSDSSTTVGVQPVEIEKRRWMLASTLLNAFLALVKLVWGLYSGSTVVLADAIHSLSDVIGAALIYIAVRVAPHHSRRFPLGLYKLEDMAAVAAGVGVLFAGYEILRSVFVGEGVTPPNQPLATLVIMGAILALQVGFFVFEKRASKRLRSPGLNSDVANWFGDIGSGIVVLVGIGGHLLRIPYVQEFAVVIIALLIFHSAFEVIRDGLLSLLDASLAQEEEQVARDFLLSVPGIERVSELIVRKAGSALFLKATVEMDNQGFDTAHQLVDELEEQLKRKIPALEKVTIHYEPFRKPQKRIALLYASDRKTPATVFGKAHSILIRDLPENASDLNPPAGSATREIWVTNPFLDDPHGRAIKLAAWLIRQRVDKVYLNAEKAPVDGSANALVDLLASAGIVLEPRL